MEALCDVGRGKIKANRFALTASRAAEIRVGVDFSEFFGKIFLRDKEIQIPVHSLDFFKCGVG